VENLTVSATLNVTSLYHDTLLDKVARDDPRYKPLLPSSPHTRYTRSWADRVGSYKWAARMLEVIKFTQLFIEMGLRRKVSVKTKWRGIVLLETIKYGLYIMTKLGHYSNMTF
jgi:peroxin-16